MEIDPGCRCRSQHQDLVAVPPWVASFDRVVVHGGLLPMLAGIRAEVEAFAAAQHRHPHTLAMTLFL